MSIAGECIKSSGAAAGCQALESDMAPTWLGGTKKNCGTCLHDAWHARKRKGPATLNSRGGPPGRRMLSSLRPFGGIGARELLGPFMVSAPCLRTMILQRFTSHPTLFAAPESVAAAPRCAPPPPLALAVIFPSLPFTPPQSFRLLAQLQLSQHWVSPCLRTLSMLSLVGLQELCLSTCSKLTSESLEVRVCLTVMTMSIL